MFTVPRPNTQRPVPSPQPNLRPPGLPGPLGAAGGLPATPGPNKRPAPPGHVAAPGHLLVPGLVGMSEGLRLGLTGVHAQKAHHRGAGAFGSISNLDLVHVDSILG